ncbi:MAG: sulfite oxidase [candidate division NC10 bacterium CSP1-5]|nr:MAG: sulfite oxidase [candidate division NC10 bacterium CSP1-5]
MREDLRDERTYWAERRTEQLWRWAQAAGLSRRRFLRLLAGGGGAAALAAFGPRAAGAQSGSPAQAQPAKPQIHAKPTPSELFIHHGTNQEMRWEAMYGRGYVMPNAMFFIRNHDPSPTIDVKTWRLKVEGPGVAHPLELTYEEILRLPSQSVVRYIECAGNGRVFHKEVLGKPAKGTQWRLGAYGVAEWTGVPLKEILDRAKLKRSAVDVMPTGLDTRKIERPMSVAKALEDDTLLVYAMNGDVLPADHGFPVRVLVPGWIGIANIKWVGRLFVSEEPVFVEKNTKDYVLIGPDFPEKPPAKGPILTLQTLKSAIALPWPATLSAGKHLTRGYAWSPHGKIAKVEYSVDGGKTWAAAQLREPNLPRAGVRWEFAWDAKPGDYTVMTRATDEKGNTQPETVRWNELGYEFSAVIRHPVTVT